MKTLRVDLKGRGYDILIAAGLLDRAGEELKKVCPGANRIFVVTDDHVQPLYYNRVKASMKRVGLQYSVHVLPAGERAKSAAHLADLWEAIDRKSVV